MMAIAGELSGRLARSMVLVAVLVCASCRSPLVLVNETKSPVEVEAKTRNGEIDLKEAIGAGQTLKRGFRPNGAGSFLLSVKFPDGRKLGPIKVGYYTTGEWTFRAEHVITFREGDVLDYNGRS